MNAAAGRRHVTVTRLGVGGGVLGAAAGIVQATIGARIPDWTGAKAAPVPLGLFTVALSLLAILAAVRQRRPGLRAGSRATYALGLLAPGLLCFSTVGRLWYLPGPLLILAGALSVDSVRDTVTVVATNRWRCLLGVLGAAELLMAAGAAPVPMAVGILGGLALLAASFPRHVHRTALLGLLIAGTVPFAAVGWTAIVPVLLLFAAAAVAVPIVRVPIGRVPIVRVPIVRVPIVHGPGR